MAPHPKECGRKLLDALLEGQDGEAMKLLKEKVDFSVECKGDNPIHLAARNGKLDIIKQMKHAGADLQQRNLHGNSAVHYAAKGGHLDVVKYLKQHDVDMNIQNDNGESPLDKAVTSQTMNVIEALVDLGMNPNAKNRKTGDTPLFTAVRSGAQEAMEGLLIMGAKPGIRNKKDQKAEDVAANRSIKESLRMYTTLLLAISARNIKAKGLKISRKDFKQSMLVDRVGVVLEKFDIPEEFPTGFYCRREKTENATIALKKIKEESLISDIFYIRIFEVNRDCPVQINLPLYKAPTDKEQMVLRFYNCSLEDRTVDECVLQNKVPYCPFTETLVPETNYACVVHIRQKKEENKITDEGTKITSELEKEFELEVPAGSFEGETVLSLQVYATDENDTNDENVSDELDDDDISPDAKPKQPSRKMTQRNKRTKSEDKPDTTTDSPLVNRNLLSDVYQINVSGNVSPQEKLRIIESN